MDAGSPLHRAIAVSLRRTRVPRSLPMSSAVMPVCILSAPGKASLSADGSGDCSNRAQHTREVLRSAAQYASKLRNLLVGIERWGGRRLMKTSSCPAVVSRLSKLLGALLAAVVVIGFGLSTAGTASAATNGGGPTRAAWRHQMQHLAVPAKGCFTGSYPTIRWQQVQCHAAPKIPFAPREAPRIVSRHGVRPVAVAALKPASRPRRRGDRRQRRLLGAGHLRLDLDCDGIVPVRLARLHRDGHRWRQRLLAPAQHRVLLGFTGLRRGRDPFGLPRLAAVRLLGELRRGVHAVLVA